MVEPSSASRTEAHCPIEIDSVHSRSHPAIGGATLDALLTGIHALEVVLHAFIEHGGRVLYPEDGTDVPLDALFGSLLHKIGPPDHDPSPG